ncbi:hypothetical protein D0A37_26240 [Microcoleus vaginatus HSN003]|nr:hypothetical protein D0A37_26240 [Microcoleus vaginatus HSN003]
MRLGLRSKLLPTLLKTKFPCRVSSGRSQCRQYRGDRNAGKIRAAGAKFQTIWYNQTASSNNFQ